MLRLTKSQYAQLARSAEHILKKAKDHMQGSGPDDYGAPDMLETYLYRHPMGMLEFWVDDGGIAGGGFDFGTNALTTGAIDVSGLSTNWRRDEPRLRR